MQILNIFKNIKSLEIHESYDKLKITSKINLCKLESLTLENPLLLNCFTGLKSLNHINVGSIDEISSFEGIFDPSKIISLQTGNIKNTKVLYLFKNLRTLKLIIEGEYN